MMPSPARPYRLVLALATLLVSLGAISAAPTSAAAPRWAPGPERYGHTLVSNIHITMSDGVDLVGDVTYPTDKATGQTSKGRFPVLLEQNPYECQVPSTSDNSYFVGRGYIWATVCIRGTGRSGGDFGLLSRRDQQDGVELVEWAAHRLAGSNGVVGLAGGSYEGLTQLNTAGGLPPHSPVKELSPVFAGDDPYRESFASGGVPTETMEYMFPGIAGLMDARAGTFGAKVAEDVLSGGPKAYYGSFWKARDLGRFAPHIASLHIPAFFLSGWQDIFNRTSQQMYAYLQNAAAGRPIYGPMKADQKVTPRYQILIGNWGHGSGIDNTIMLQWYDTWLKNSDTPLRHSRDPMHLFQKGTSAWINTRNFPMVARYTPYYLGEEGDLSSTAPMAVGQESLPFGPSQGASLTHTSPAFPKGATLAGPISATITAASSGRNLDLITSLYDVAQDGSATLITQGNLAGSFAKLDPERTWRDDRGVDVNPYPLYDKDRWLTPGRPVTLNIGLEPTVYVLAPGHRVRLVVTTMWDESACNALLGPHPCFPTTSQLQTFAGTYTVLHGARQQSAVNLPLLPHGTFMPTGGTGAEPAHF
jgi:predicted acyl esterase